MPASKENQWSSEEDSLIRELVKNKVSTKHMSLHFPKRTPRGVECRVYTLGLKSGTPRQVHTKNESFWETPNALNCYYAGLAAADMSVDLSNHSLSWGCESGDEEYMLKFIKNVESTTKIFHTIKGEFERTDCMATYIQRNAPRSGQSHSNIRICAAQKWHRDMEKNFNIVPNKTYRLRPPNLGSDYLMSCYLVGLLDGDGAISFSREFKIAHIAYGSASKDIVHWVREFVDSHFQFSVKKKPPAVVKEKLDGRYFHTSIYGMKAVKFIELMKTLPIPRFSRKWDNPELLAIIDHYHQKWPQYFTPDQEMAFDSSGNIVFAKTLAEQPTAPDLAAQDQSASQLSPQISPPPV